MRSNCVVFAVLLYLRRLRRRREGYLVLRKSRLGWFCHVLYAEQRANGTLRTVGYRPLNPVPRPCPPALFAGRSKWGDL